VHLQLVEEVAELVDEERIRLRQATELLRVAVVVGETVAGLGDADVRDCAPLPSLQIMQEMTRVESVRRAITIKS
jgi:hypothetical protein